MKSWIFRTATAASFSLLFLGSPTSVHAQDNTAAVAPAGFSGLSFTVRSATLMGSSTSFNIQADGSYTITTDGGMAHFIMIRGQGKLSPSQLKSIETAVSKLDKATPPASLPGLVPGSEGFTISWDGKSTGGALNMKEAIADAKQRGLDVSAWKAVEPIVTKINSLETKLESSYNPVKPAPEKKADFDSVTIEERNSWTGGTTKLTVNGDGTYTLERPLGQSTLTGTLTKSQLDKLTKAYNEQALSADNGKFVGSVIPDDTLFTITAKEGGKTYTVNGAMDSKNLGPLQQLENVLAGDANKFQPPAAAPLKDASVPDDAKKFFDGVSAARAGATPADAAKAAAALRTARTTGMSGSLDARVNGEADKADGKEIQVDGK